MQIHHRILDGKLANNQADERKDGDHHAPHDEWRPEPVVSLALIQHDLQETQSQSQQPEADEIDLPALLRRYTRHARRFMDQHRDQQQRNHADRHVQQENPSPRIIVSDPSAERGPDRRRYHHAHAVNRHGHALLFARKAIDQDGLRHRLHPPAAGPHSSELNVKMITHPIKNLLRPNSAENHPVRGNTIALETRYDVSTHVLSSTPADKFPAMCGRDTFATLVSNTSMNVAAITVMAINQGFTCGTETGRAAYSAVAAIDVYTRFSGGRSFSPGNMDQSRAAGPVSCTSDSDAAGDPPSNLCGARQRSTTEI